MLRITESKKEIREKQKGNKNERCKLKTNDAAKELKKMEEGGVVVPESVTDSVNRTSNNFQEFRTNFLNYLPLCDPDTLLELDPLQRA
ncbi:hypothetical protein LXL04_028335 [Taraxacum kok-saghyz]